MPKRNTSSEESPVFSALTIENRKQISTELFEKLRDAILSGALPAGYVFPNENELCQRLNIGRSSLREAYSPLETLHLITRTKAGTYVNDRSTVQNSMNLEAIAHRSPVQSLADYRRIVEIGAVELAASIATDEHIAHLENILKAMEQAGDDPAMLSQLDFDFHSTLMQITGNDLLLITFNTIRAVYEDYTESVFASGYHKQSLSDHKAIIRALQNHSSADAAHAMQRHLIHVEDFRVN